LRRLVLSLREGIYITDDQGNLVDVNPAFLELFGVRSLSELSDYRSADLLVDPGQRDEELEILRKEGSVREFEFDIRTPEGTVRTVLDTAYTVHEPDTGQVLYHGMLVDITRRKQLEEKLKELSIRDPLTGLFNRRHLGEISRWLAGEDVCWGAIVIDVDHFKAYNDRFGHQAGDKILTGLGRFLSQTVRGDDVVFRIGGDEFLVVVVGVIQEATEIVVQRLRDRAYIACPASFTLGWAVRNEDEILEETIGRADLNLIKVRVETRRRFDRRLPEKALSDPPPTGRHRRRTRRADGDLGNVR
jgi:diguanylate cyclase (GGDEF)-like protein/PAS domain S-box-containing protein